MVKATLSIQECVIPFRIGAHTWEQHLWQPLSFTIHFSYDIRLAAREDDLSLAIDYSAIPKILHTLAQERHFVLLESLAVTICQTLREKLPQIDDLQVSISKPKALTEGRAVSIELHDHA